MHIPMGTVFLCDRGNKAAQRSDEPNAGYRVEQVRLTRLRAKRDPVASLGRVLRLAACDEPADLGRGKDIRIGADLLDDLDLDRDAVARELDRLRPQADHHIAA